MKDRMERLVILPFSIGCLSESSVAVAVHPRRSKRETLSPSIRTQEDEEESLSSESMKNSFRFLALPKPELSNGFHRLFKSFKSFSQLFVYKEDMEELGRDMQIGFPTNVKHVTHIGCDDPACINTLASVSLRQFELSMVPQPDTPLVEGSVLA
ncbi:PBD domain-containing protein [Cephalotus follicularis]|uniref:PBD domain-containing protein n=1 Tax=Cephalotus follicularis TaxID=3775 RepID=A0A1Q3B1R9_CEPFO|nr:PBD domain-containing protein [Cephalotus follicularis]